jgi:GGDEF domain-containing protein
VAERFARHVARAVDLGGGTITPRVTIGVAWAPNGEVDAELLVARADLAMYGAKRRRDGVPAMWSPTDDPAGGARTEPEVGTSEPDGRPVPVAEAIMGS